MRIFLFLCVIVAVVGVGCSSRTSANDNIAQVKVTTDGKIFLNGMETTLERLQSEFALLGAADGSVVYYRENPESEPHPIAEAVIHAVISAELPIRFSEQDFS